MIDNLSFTQRFWRTALPTLRQIAGALFLAICIIAIMQSSSLLRRFGVSENELKSSQVQVGDRFSSVTHSILASNIALIAFWSVVGLLAYVMCWAAYNFIIEARNQVTLETQYENLGDRTGLVRAVVIKVVVGAALAVAIFCVKYALALSLALVTPAIATLDPLSMLAALGGIVILGVYLYMLFALVELLLSAWYQPQAFTDV